ncbi:glycoside hydrolase [Triangularia setosa]|uniref:alpha-1,2-Mannosidase n=1 Tax=Triangularia setosa TaxID=2587417 RepID=A0AAN6WJS5_9PEZI|nr:glycoside hydrolase [Podospora setosa]
MNVRDPFNIRGLNRDPIASWRPKRNTTHDSSGNTTTTLQSVIRTAAATAAAETAAAAELLREKASEVLLEAGASLLPVTTTNTDDNDSDTRTTEEDLGDDQEDMSSFSIPKNVPSFSNPQRQYEDRLWAAATNKNSKPGNILSGVQDIISGGNRAALPMYKDKPYIYPPGRGGCGGGGGFRPRRKRTLGLLLLAVAGLGAAGRLDTGWGWGRANWLKRRERVVEAMKLSWDAYERYAWESKSGKQMVPKGLGWIIIDSLDTLMLMNLTDRLSHAREWLAKDLTWEQDEYVNTFETTIRMLGGLLSAHYLSTTFPQLAPIADDDPGKPGEDLYLEKAKDLADRLMAAFDSPSGIPYASVNLKEFKGIISHADMGASSTAETTTLQLEFKYLAKLTGEKDFWDKAEKVIQLVDDNGAEDGLVPIFIFATTGKFHGENIRLGSRGDSYYEYLIKQYLQTNKKEPVYQEMWDEALQGVRKHLITYTEPSQFTIIGERPSGLKKEFSPKMDHLVCFMPGTIALAATGGLTEKEARGQPTWTDKNEADMQLARELMHTCWGMYKYMATGLAAEITYFNIPKEPLGASAPHKAPAEFDPDPEAEWRKDFDVKPQDSHNLQRPETVESLFYMWRITGEEKYRDWGWEMFKSFMNYTAVEDGGGFTSLSNANIIPPRTRDNMESFWLAETLKYFYLLFSPNDLLPLDKVVFNTEAHPFPRFDMGPLFSTGWKRKPRDEITSINMGSLRSGMGREFLSSYPEDDDSNSTSAHSHPPSHYVQNWVSSFRRDPGRRITPATVVHSVGSSNRSSTVVGVSRSNVSSSAGGGSGGEKDHHGGHFFDLHAANVNTANTMLSRELKGRHLQMIAIGGSIGTGLFVASGSTLTAGGPASMLLAYAFIGGMLYCTMQALGELAVAFPVAGSFSAYSTRFLDPALGFSMGWNYALQWLVCLPLEIIAASMTVNYWKKDAHRSVFVTIFLVAILVINLFGVKGYGEAEFIFSVLKVIAVIGFILLGIVINIGGFPDEGYIGGKYWYDPGAFNNGFKGFCTIFVTAAFAFTGIELVGLAAAEAVNPRKSLPTAIKQVFWRITLFYLISLTLVGLLVPYNHPDLLGAESFADASSSPFVIAIESAGIAILPGIMNAVILVAVVSVGNSAVFGSSRTLAALADQGQAPKILGYVDRRGRPLISILVASAFGLLGYLADLAQPTEVLNWLLAVTGLSSIFTWASICLAHIRFRNAWRIQGRSLSELSYLSQAGVAGSWIGFGFNVLVLIAHFWTAAWPIPPTLPDPDAVDDWTTAPEGGHREVPTSPTGNGIGVTINNTGDVVHNFFLQCSCVPVIIVFWAGYKVWYRTKIVKLEEIDLDTGRRRAGVVYFNDRGRSLPVFAVGKQELEREREREMRRMPRWKRVYRLLC